MSKDKTAYITTPIYYITAAPHLGNSYTTIAGDVYARFKRMDGFDVIYLTGTDEHGEKVAKAAKENGKTPKEHVDTIVKLFYDSWKILNIQYDDFIRTTEERHEKVVTELIKRAVNNGDIYLDEYEGWYCVSCETFFMEKQLAPNKTCPDCGKSVEMLKEESYFFKLSKYSDSLLKHIESNPEFVLPSFRKNEVVSFINEGLRDISITRTTVEWGVPMPKSGKEKKEHTVYVWFDALINYISALGCIDTPKKFNKYWPHAIHLIGKDILKFHAVYWPAFLMSVGLPLPKTIFAHGWWTVEGEKMSKSKNNFINPFDVVSKYGLDAYRYFLLREIPFGLDGDYSERAITGRINSDLANDLGNLVSRTVAMTIKYLNGKIEYVPANDFFENMIPSLLNNVRQNINSLTFSKVLDEIWSFISSANKYLGEKQPWILAKDPQNMKEVHDILASTIEAIRIISVLIAPFMPESSAKINSQIGCNTSFGDVSEALNWGKIQETYEVTKGEPIFPRIEQKKQQ